MSTPFENAAVYRRRSWVTTLLLLALFLLPNLVTLRAAFVWDDLPQLIDDDSVHSLANLGRVWTQAYWPGGAGLALYRPLTKTLWTLLWAGGGGQPWVFHLANLALGGAAVLLVRRVLLRAGYAESAAFSAAALFALLPIHTEATATVVGSAELLSAVLCLGCYLAYADGRKAAALVLLVAAVLSKESAVVFPFAVLLAFHRERPMQERLAVAAVSAGVAGTLLLAGRLVSAGPASIPLLYNPLAGLAPGWRLVSALWVQLLYLAKTCVPLNLSADYSFNQIPAIVSLADPRAWAALALPAGAVLLCATVRAARAPVILTAVLAAPTANIFFPIGTIMGERLAYLPSLGPALGGALLLAIRARDRNLSRQPLPAGEGAVRSLSRSSVTVLAALAVVFGVRSFERNLTWVDSDRFTATLTRTAPGSANAWFSRGALLAWREEHAAAVEHYDRALRIFPQYPDALFNRANSLVLLGRLREAAEGYRACLSVDPGHADAALALEYLEQGITFRPQSHPY